MLIDFTAYGSAESGARNLLLREIYDKYASQGLEIYQVSLDTDEHFWKPQLIICLGFAFAILKDHILLMSDCMV